MKHLFCTLLILVSITNINSQNIYYSEQHRPQFHFTPATKWINDPNGMVYNKGIYHLFYQHFPDSSIWGPMHWGHATSTDLLHWQHKEIALFPDSLGMIYSGSAVVDYNNTSGFGKDGKMPLVAIFTHHNSDDKFRNDFENQSLAYSLDEGITWNKYKNNPTLLNPGNKNFRDPKVMWFEKSQKWIMSLSTGDRITFYSSKDLKSWKKESEFGESMGAHGGVWECPDLFPFTLNDTSVWVLLVSINPGGPNGGSATQYFIGNFDGSKFTSFDNEIKYIDWGPDNYAGVTWSNTGMRKIFIGWMSNWQYANEVPTYKWRGALTIPRELTLKTVKNSIYIVSNPVKEFENILATPLSLKKEIINGSFDLSTKTQKLHGQYVLKMKSDNVKDFSIILSNEMNEELVIGFDQKLNQYYIDRSKAGKINFSSDFPKRHFGPRISTSKSTDIVLLVDASSVELFADNGLTCMTEIFFPNKIMNKLAIKSIPGITLNNISISSVKGVWDPSK